MEKNVFFCVDLTTILQDDVVLSLGQCYRGALSRTSNNHYLFEELADVDRHGRRNPKLFKGKYLSMVRMQNGKYQVHMRTIDASTTIDHKELAAQVYGELIEALGAINVEG